LTFLPVGNPLPSALIGVALMNWSVKRDLYLHREKGLSELQLFNQLVDIAASDTIEGVMTSIPPNYLARFRQWIDRILPSLDTLINLKTGPLSEHEKATIRAIAEWLDRHPAEDRLYGEETSTSANGLDAADPLQAVKDSRSPAI
jgi:hypothetical protein